MLQDITCFVAPRSLLYSIPAFVMMFLVMFSSSGMAQNFKIDWEKELPKGAKIVVEKTFYDKEQKHPKFVISYAVLANGEKVKHGPDETYRRTGKLARIRYYKLGKEHGPQSRYNKNGTFRSAHWYLEGRQVAITTYLKVYGKETLTAYQRKWFKVK